MRFVHLGVLLLNALNPSVVAAGQPTEAGSAVRLSLDEAVREALDKNLDLIAARAGISIADANLITAGLRPNPILSLDANHLDWLGTGFNSFNAGRPVEYGARVDFLIEAANGPGASSSHDRTAPSRRRRFSTPSQRCASTCRTPSSLQLAQDNLALARENAAAFAEIVTLNQARVKSGDLAEVEMLRSRMAALQSQQTIRQAELDVRRARQHLERVLSRTPGGIPIEIEPIARPAAVTSDAATLRARVDGTTGSAGAAADPRPIAGRHSIAAGAGADRLQRRGRVSPADGQNDVARSGWTGRGARRPSVSP